MSTTGPFRVPGLAGRDEDVAGFCVTGLGGITTGAFDTDPLLAGRSLGLAANDVTGIAYLSR